MNSFIHSFISAISIAPLQVLYYSEALPTTARILELISFYHISPKFGFAPPIFLTSLHPAVSETYWPVNHGSAKKVKGVGKGTDQSREPKAKLTYRKELTEQFGYAWSIATEKSDKSQSRRVTEE